MTLVFFLSIADRARLLKHRDLTFDANTVRILMSDGYHSIVNGYKNPFFDKSFSLEFNDG